MHKLPVANGMGCLRTGHSVLDAAIRSRPADRLGRAFARLWSALGPSLARPCSSLACPRPVLDLALTFPDAAATPETSGPRAVTTDVFGERPPASAHPHRVGRYAVTGIAHADG